MSKKVTKEDLSENLMTSTEVADYLNVSPVKVRTMASDGEIPFVRLKQTAKGHMRFDPKDVRAFVKGRKESE